MSEVESEVQLLHAEVDEDGESYFRLLCQGKHVRYVTIASGLFTTEDMCFGPALIPLLPAFPPGDWNYGNIARSPEDGKPCFTETARRQLLGVHNVWHSTHVDHLDITYRGKLRTGVYVATTPLFPTPIVAKFARFDWEVGYLDDECAAYQWIEGQNIGPEFLGHLVEDGRHIGFLMENLSDSRHAEIGDLTACQQTLSRLHQLGIIHGDVNKFNFLIRTDGHATLIDFDCARKCDDQEEMEKELQSLAARLVDTSGRGGSVQIDVEA